MGGTDITSVTENVEITAKATDNQIILSINSDGTDYRGTNGEDGFKRGFRIANGKEHADEGWTITGFIPVSVGDTLRIKNVDITYQGVPDFGVYNYSFTLQQGTSLYSLFGTKGTYSNGVYTYKISSYDLNAFNSTQCEYIRFCSKQLDENSIITINKEIN